MNSLTIKRFCLIACGIMITAIIRAQSFSEFIVVDQFGYLPAATKIAFIRDPQTGYDAASSFTPGTSYAVMDAALNTPVFTGTPTAWKGGATDASSGDKVWWFDFSSVATPGNYYVKDITQNVRSATFNISDTVYKSILKASMRMLFYQRSSFPKSATYAGAGWADGASHIGPLQDKNARLYNNKVLATEKDLHGGWYDAGDLNKYTPWTASYVVTLLTAYRENPSAFSDDYNIPESGNGIPDIIDEVKWGLDHLLRMQQGNGSCLSVLSSAGGSPPSVATGQSVYGPATTNATFKCAQAFAVAAKIYRQVDPVFYKAFADTLEVRAVRAYNWGIANPSKQFNNNTASNGSSGVAAGNQETDSLGRFTAKMGAALYLYDLTGQASYLTLFESGYTSFPLVAWYNYVSQYFLESQDLMFYYLTLPGISTTVANDIRTRSLTSMKKSGDFLGAYNDQTDPYRSFIHDYNWGSNQYKSNYGYAFWEMNKVNLDPSNSTAYLKASEEYLHYIHGANPLQLVYLTNMSSYGAEKSLNEMYHTWFADGSAKWDRVGTSTYGPPPGYLTGGANPGYNFDGCCSNNTCGSTSNNALCTSQSLTPPKGQPAQKSYKDFNSSWPLNSWSLTETSLGYQTSYIRLLSKFVHLGSITTGASAPANTLKASIRPNPTQDQIMVEFPSSVAVSDMVQVNVFDMLGNKVLSQTISNNSPVSLTSLTNGIYIIQVSQEGLVFTDRVVKIQ